MTSDQGPSSWDKKVDNFWKDNDFLKPKEDPPKKAEEITEDALDEVPNAKDITVDTISELTMKDVLKPEYEKNTYRPAPGEVRDDVPNTKYV